MSSVGANHKFGDEFVGEGIEVLAVECTIGTASEVALCSTLEASERGDLRELTMPRDVLSNLCHGVTHSGVGVQEMVMLVRIPFTERRKFL